MGKGGGWGAELRDPERDPGDGGNQEAHKVTAQLT